MPFETRCPAGKDRILLRPRDLLEGCAPHDTLTGTVTLPKRPVNLSCTRNLTM